eukprot:m.78667 g.78667  ORF g.78667 m.78667 type:complete len:185 (+) comp25139_c0_seq1:798-1352(+)
MNVVTTHNSQSMAPLQCMSEHERMDHYIQAQLCHMQSFHSQPQPREQQPPRQLRPPQPHDLTGGETLAAIPVQQMFLSKSVHQPKQSTVAYSAKQQVHRTSKTTSRKHLPSQRTLTLLQNKLPTCKPNVKMLLYLTLQGKVSDADAQLICLAIKRRRQRAAAHLDDLNQTLSSLQVSTNTSKRV